MLGIPSRRVAILGYVARFNRRYFSDKDGVYEIDRGALNSAVVSPDLRLLINHDRKRIVASRNTETLSVGSDTNGLFLESSFDPQQWPWLYGRLCRGETYGSFGAVSEQWTYRNGTRTLRGCGVVELTIVASGTPSCISTWLVPDTPASRRIAQAELKAARRRVLEMPA